MKIKLKKLTQRILYFLLFFGIFILEFLLKFLIKISKQDLMEISGQELKALLERNLLKDIEYKQSAYKVYTKHKDISKTKGSFSRNYEAKPFNDIDLIIAALKKITENTKTLKEDVETFEKLAEDESKDKLEDKDNIK